MLQNLFEYGESTKPPAKPQDGTQPADSPEIQSTEWADNDPNRPFLSHATFRMCILADALLEDFFDSDLTNSWRLEVLVPEEKPKPQTLAGGWWGGLVSAIVTDENKVRTFGLHTNLGILLTRPWLCRSASTGSQMRLASDLTSRQSSSVRLSAHPTQ